MLKNFWLLTFLFLSQTACNNQEVCYPNNYPNVSSYHFRATGVTLRGVVVDDPLLELDLEELDRQVSSLEECLRVSIEETCFVVKVAPDWYISECSDQQLFPCENSKEECFAKGLTEEDLSECSCNCRARIQDDYIIIVTPNLLLFRGELARMITGENNPWPKYGPCLI